MKLSNMAKIKDFIFRPALDSAHASTQNFESGFRHSGKLIIDRGEARRRRHTTRHRSAPAPRIDTRPANRKSCPMLDILTLPATLAALIATAGAVLCVVAWYCWSD